MRNKQFNFYSAPIENWLLKNKTFDRSGKMNNPYYHLSHQRMVVSALYDEENNTLTFGISKCSKKDQFVRSQGRHIASNRALTNPVILEERGEDEDPIVTLNLPEGVTMKEVNRIFINQARLLVEENGLPVTIKKTVVQSETLEEE